MEEKNHLGSLSPVQVHWEACGYLWGMFIQVYHMKLIQFDNSEELIPPVPEITVNVLYQKANIYILVRMWLKRLHTFFIFFVEEKFS